MEVSQKKFTNKARFSFGEKELKYTIQDKSGSKTFSVEYASIPKDFAELEERNVWYRNVGLVWALLGGFIIISRYMETGALKGSIWFTLGIICMTVYWLAKTKYTVINTESGTVYIIKDKQHEKVLNEIDARRKGQWLLREGAISEEECQQTIGKITTFHDLQQTTTQQDESRTIN